MSEQRYRAVLAVIAEGCTVSEVAARFGVSRQTLHAWLSKYEAGGLENLGDGSHRPRSCPHQMSGEVEVLVAELRRAHPSWGPKRLVFELAKHRYRVAQTALEQVDEPVDLVRVQRVVDEASWSMARARAILDGRDAPPPPDSLRHTGPRGEPAVGLDDDDDRPTYVEADLPFRSGWFGGSSMFFGPMFGFGTWVEESGDTDELGDRDRRRRPHDR